MKRSPMPPRKAWPKRHTRIKARNAKRFAKNHARAYGGDERIAWVQSLPCVVPDCADGPRECAHVRTGGVGRRADASAVVPLCAYHHRIQHAIGVVSFASMYGLDLAALAELTERAWQQTQRGAA